MKSETKINYSNHIYILNTTIYFDVNKRTLTDKQTEIELSVSSSRLLCILILNANEVISRDSLLRDVWEENNLTASNGNLNKNIYTVRKCLSKFGINHALETIPKQGFILHVNVSYEKKTKILNFFLQKKNLAAIILLIFGFLVILFFYDKIPEGNFDFTYIEKFKSCKVYSSVYISPEQANSFLESKEGEQLMKDCSRHSIDVYVDSDTISKLNVKGKFFVGACNNVNGNNQCENFIYL